VLHTEIFLPGQFDGLPVSWARNREKLWNTAEHAEKRHNARVAREYQVSLPAELNAGQRIALARAFSRHLAERYKVAVDLSVHEPRPGGDPRNFHAHLLTTTREVTPAGLGAKAGLDLQALERRRRELPDHRQEYLILRERWATLVNEALREAKVAARVDHRSLAAQGIDRESLPRIPLMQLKMEQRGVRSELAERLRAEYRERVQRRVERSAVRAPESAPGVASARAAEGGGKGSHPPAQIQDVEEIRRQAREAWLRLRPKEAERAGGERTASERTASEREAHQPTQQAEDDLAL
jgi:MobA/MobL family